MRRAVVGVRRVMEKIFEGMRFRVWSWVRSGGDVRRESWVVGGERPRRAPDEERVRLWEWEGEHIGKVRLMGLGG